MIARTSTLLSPLASVLALALALPGATPCRADFFFEVANVTVAAGQSGSFDVLLRNTDSTTYRVASDSVRLALTGVSGVSFTGATTGTVAAPYLYVQSGVAATGSPLSFDPFPATSFTASDSEFGPLGYRAIAPGGVFGVAHVSFTVAATAAPGAGLMSFLDPGASTSLADPSGAAIAFTTQPGTFTILPSTSAVPEPSSLVLMALAGALAAPVAASRRGHRAI